MKRNTIKKLGIVIMSAVIAASPVVTPFTTMTVYAEELVDNDGTIATNLLIQLMIDLGEHVLL